VLFLIEIMTSYYVENMEDKFH